MRKYLDDTSIENLELGSWFRLQFGVRFMRTLYIEKHSSDDKPAGEMQVVPKPESQSEIARLKNLLQQRDAEIDILTQMVGGDVPKPKKEAGPQYDYDNVADGYFEEQQEIEDGKELSFQKSRPSSASTCNSKVQSPARRQADVQSGQQGGEPISKPPPRQPKLSEQEAYLNVLSSAKNIAAIDLNSLSLEQLKNEDYIFTQFQQNYYNRDTLSEDKQQLQMLYKDAKHTASQVMELKKRADAGKAELIQMIQTAGRETEESDFVKDQLQKINKDYQEKIKILKAVKVQIESLEASMQQNKDKLKKDFVKWYKYAVEYIQKRQQKQAREQKPVESPVSRTFDQEIEDEIQAFYSAKKKAGL